MKRKSLSKYSKTNQDAIINIQPGAKAILYESNKGDVMTTNEMLKVIMNDVSGLKSDISILKEDMSSVNKRLDNIDKRLENIENTPTMKRELKA